MPLTENDILSELYNNLDTELRADEKFYVDCTDVRGGDELAQKLCDDLSHTNGFMHVLFSGNIGCGKSSELRHFATAMNSKILTFGRKRFFPVVIDTAEYLDRSDVDITDILLAIISETADALRLLGNITFRPSLVERVLTVVRQFVPASIEAKIGSAKALGVEGAAAELKISLQRLQKDPTVRQKVRAALANETLTFYEEINIAFHETRVALKSHSVADGEGAFFDFVIILDNLEKVDRFEKNEEGAKSHRALFIEKASQFQSLKAHLILTVPLALVRAEGKRLGQLYTDEPLILPNIKTEYRGEKHVAYLPGRERLKDILQARMPEGVLVDNIFDAEALAFITDNCGGHVRNFLRSARESISYARYTSPVTKNAAHRSIGRQVRIFADVMRPDDWNLVAELELSELQTWNSHDPAKARLLEQTVVLEYLNGSMPSEDDVFAVTDDDEDYIYKEKIAWYGVNPIVRKMPAFALALAQTKELREKAKAKELLELSPTDAPIEIS